MKKVNGRQLMKAFSAVFFSAVLLSCNKRNDSEIRQDIATKLQNNDAYKDVTATVQNGVVTLSGTCMGDSCAAKAEEVVKDVDDVESVQNNIKMAQAGTDLTLRTNVLQIVSRYPSVKADVVAGVIILRGVINKNQVQPLMNELEALQPEKIDNQLAVQ